MCWTQICRHYNAENVPNACGREKSGCLGNAFSEETNNYIKICLQENESVYFVKQKTNGMEHVMFTEYITASGFYLFLNLIYSQLSQTETYTHTV